MVFLQVIVGGLLLGAIYALFSSGLTLIWGMMNFINFAHGEFVMLGMYVAFLVVVWIGGGPAIFTLAAAFALLLLGIAIYLSLIRHVIRGPMVAQIVGGVLAVILTLALHVLLTRTVMGSRLLAVAEDRAAAMLMGIRPDRMQMLAWGLSAGAAGIAGALMATAYPWSPSVGETFGLIAFVVVALGGFGSVIGSLYAGLIIGLIQAISAFWLGAIYKDIVVYGLFVALLWFRPQGLMGKA